MPQLESISQEKTDDSDGEDENGRGKKPKRVCGEGRNWSDSDSEGEVGMWLKREMEELEEQERGKIMGREEETNMFWD